jgi:hypothetical protein
MDADAGSAGRPCARVSCAVVAPEQDAPCFLLEELLFFSGLFLPLVVGADLLCVCRVLPVIGWIKCRQKRTENAELLTGLAATMKLRGVCFAAMEGAWVQYILVCVQLLSTPGPAAAV